MLPVAQREVQLPPAIPPVEPSPQFAARVAAGIFAGQAAILLVIGFLPHQGPSFAPRLVIATGSALVALILHLGSARIGPVGLQAATTFGTLLVSFHLLFSVDEPSLSDEMLYIWPALYAAYFFPVRPAAFQLGLMSMAYLGVLVISAPSDLVAGSWLTLVGVIFPAAGLLRAVRDAVTGLVRSLSEAARTDTLTGLKNRLALEHEIHVEVERTLRNERQLSIVIGDLDHFKLVNDELGHRAGDQALVRIGQILDLRRRTGDSIARTGGEEFTLLLPGSSEHEAFVTAERMRSPPADWQKLPHPSPSCCGRSLFPKRARAANQAVFRFRKTAEADELDLER